jgi:hypothetical protein
VFIDKPKVSPVLVDRDVVMLLSPSMIFIILQQVCDNSIVAHDDISGLERQYTCILFIQHSQEVQKQVQSVPKISILP